MRRRVDATRMGGSEIRKIRAAAAAAILATGMVFGGLATAAPVEAATCFGASCTGKYPHTTGCDTAGVATIEKREATSYVDVLLQHSSGCGTFWAWASNDFP